MKINIIPHRRILFSRFLFFNIILIIIATLIPQIFFYNYLVLTYDHEMREYNLQNAQELKNSIDSAIVERVSNIPSIYISEAVGNADLTYPLHFNISKETAKMAAVSIKLSEIKRAFNFIDSIDIYYYKSNILFSESYFRPLDDPASLKGLDMDWTHMMKSMKENETWVLKRGTDNSDYFKKGIIAYVRAIPYHSSYEKREATIAIKIKEDYLYDFVKAGMKKRQRNYLLSMGMVTLYHTVIKIIPIQALRMKNI